MATQQTATATASISEVEHAAEEGGEEAGVIVEDEIRRVEARRIALEEREFAIIVEKGTTKNTTSMKAGKKSGV